MSEEFKIVRVDDLDKAIIEEINKMNQRAIQNCNVAAELAATAGVKELKATSPVRSGEYARQHKKYPPGSYAKSWTKKKEGNALGVFNYTIYNAKHYQLTHLLEFGHIIATGKRAGQRSKAFPHIAPVNKSASEQFVRSVESMKL